MKNAIKISLLTLVICSLLCGCSSFKSGRLTNKIIVQGIGVDYNEDEYKISVQYLDLAKAAGNSEGASAVLTKTAYSKGKSIASAFKNVEKTMSDSMFFGQIKLIVINKALLDSKAKELGEYLLSNREIRENALICIGEKSAKAVIDNSLRGERVPAEAVCRQLVMAQKKNICKACNVNDYLSALAMNKTADLPVVLAKKDYCTVLKR